MLRDPDVVAREAIHSVEPEDLLSFGLIPEFIGRLPVVSTLDALSEDELLMILTDPKNAMVKQYAKLMAMDGVGLTFTKDALAGSGSRGRCARGPARARCGRCSSASCWMSCSIRQGVTTSQRSRSIARWLRANVPRLSVNGRTKTPRNDLCREEFRRRSVSRYLFERFPSFSQTFCVREVEAMHRRGLEFPVFSIRKPAGEPVQDYFSDIGPIYFLPEKFDTILATDTNFRRSARKALESLRALWGCEEQKRRIYEALWLGPLLREAGIRHVHVHFAGSAARTAFWLKRLFGVELQRHRACQRHFSRRAPRALDSDFPLRRPWW